MGRLRRDFFAGIIITLPVVLTIWVLSQIFAFADNLLGRFISNEIRKLVGFYIPGVSLIITFVIIVLIGFLATRFLGRRFLPVAERWFLKFPFVRQIYPSVKQIVDFLFTRKKPTFTQVVMVECPRKGIWSIGFLTGDTFQEAKTKTNKELLCVYLPSSPNPITAFVAFVPKEDIIFLDISVEEGMKIIISGGILQP